jgi:hypothetical protein
MSTDPSAANQTQVTPDFATQMHEFWEKNHGQIYFLCIVVLLAIVGREGWGYYTNAREQGIEEDYAKASGSPEKLAGFASEHSGHELAGVALLHVADDKYIAGDYSAARTNYGKAAETLANNDLKSRARVGTAMSQLAGGDKAGAETALKAILTEAGLSKLARAEAAYHLASLANEAGKLDDVKKYLDEITKIDATGVWAQRGFVLRSRLPVDKAAPAESAGITFKPGGK